MNKKSPNGQIRSEEKILQNSMGGVLAEESVKIYLKEKAKEYDKNVEIYSLPFNGHLEHRDIYVKINGKIKTIEVRSSFQYKTTLQRVFSGAFSLIGNYVTSYKFTEPQKDFYIQVIHRYENSEIIKKFSDKLDVLIVGGGSNELFKKIGKNEFLKQEGATYLLINPINSTNGIVSLVKEILEIN
jgi:hypothetical protein